MAVHIEQMTSTVSVTDGSSLLTPDSLRQIVAAVVEQLDARTAREERAARDRRVAGGTGGGSDGSAGSGCGCRS